MKSFHSLEHLSKTGNLDEKLVLRQKNLNLCFDLWKTEPTMQN